MSSCCESFILDIYFLVKEIFLDDELFFFFFDIITFCDTLLPSLSVDVRDNDSL